MTYDYTQYVEPEDKSSELSDLMQLGQDLKEADAAVEAAEAVLKQLVKDAEEIRVHKIPKLMSDIGVLDFRLETGERVVSETFVNTQAKDKGTLYRWLEDHNMGWAIDRTVVCSFGLEAEAEANELAEELSGKFDRVTVDKKHNGARLKSIVKDLLAEGKELPPEEALRVHHGRRAKFE